MSNEKMKKNSYLVFLTVLLVLLLSSCDDLFTGPKVDLFQQISDEVDWANAAKLTVKVEHPAVWGTSNPTGNITPAKDIRKGYAFEIEFIPDQAYSLVEWRAYRSPLPANWTVDTELLSGIERLDGVSVEVPNLLARGGTGSFKINTTENITLVPWCKTEPYVTRTVPRNSPNTVCSRGTDIVIYFNAPLNLVIGEVDLFLTEAIKITGNGEDFTSYYNKPVYAVNADLGTYTITISPSDVPGDSLIEVTVGPNIHNAAGEPMVKAEVFSFATSPSDVSGGIENWSASYDENAQTVTVNWTPTGAADVVARYRINKGGDNPLAENKIINGVNRPDAANVRQGQSVSGIWEYEIFLDLYLEGIKSNAGSLSFKIWNIPGMNVTQTNTVQLTQANIATALVVNSTNNFILIEDINLTSTWTPVGTGSGTAAFHGKFYGNGHTITLAHTSGSGFANATYTGIFGYVKDAEIRDVTVHYAENAAAGSSTTCIGGLVGSAAGSTTLCNIIVSASTNKTLSAFNKTLSAFKTAIMGGIAGFLTDNASIENAYCALGISLASTTYFDLTAGGIVGWVGSGSKDYDVSIDDNYTCSINNVTFAGTVAVNGSGNINVGGIAGSSKTSGTMQNLLVSGTVSVTRSDDTYTTNATCGGIIGIDYDGSLIDNSFEGILTFESYGAGTNRIGGLAGAIGGTDNTQGNNSKAVSITNCFVRGNLNLTDTALGDPSKLFFGGVSGWTVGNTGIPITFIDCAYTDGEITIRKAKGISENINVGGFAGDVVANAEFINCRVLARSMIVEIPPAKVGGFSAILRANMQGCYTNFPLEVTFKERTEGPYTPNQFESWVGGFLGAFESQSSGQNWIIEKCYASGPVTVTGYGVNVNVGGLIGRLGGPNVSGVNRPYVSLKDCYATGHIIADSRFDKAISTNGGNGNFPTVVYAGGLVGYVEITSDRAISNCFATGKVTAQSSYGDCMVGAGGIAGNIASGMIRNSAALGAFVLAKGSSVSAGNVGRIAGNGTGSGFAKNYAKTSMLTQTAAYSEFNSYTSQTPLIPSGTTKNGATTPDVTFENPFFWTTPGNWDTTSGATEWVFPATWNSFGVSTRGYPLLVGLGGQ